jgi:aminoglycoside 3-N-acetyltransferase I
MKSRSSFRIKVLSANDVEVMREMLAMFGDAFDDRAAYTRAQPDDSYLGELLANGAFIAIAAMSDTRVIGGLTAYVLPKFEQVRTEIYIYDLAVDLAHRRNGIATAMIEELKKIAQAKAAYVIFVQADHGDSAAIALYTKLGSKEDVLHFDIAPNEEGGQPSVRLLSD